MLTPELDKLRNKELSFGCLCKVVCEEDMGEMQGFRTVETICTFLKEQTNEFFFAYIPDWYETDIPIVCNHMEYPDYQGHPLRKCYRINEKGLKVVEKMLETHG